MTRFLLREKHSTTASTQDTQDERKHSRLRSRWVEDAPKDEEPQKEMHRERNRRSAGRSQYPHTRLPDGIAEAMMQNYVERTDPSKNVPVGRYPPPDEIQFGNKVEPRFFPFHADSSQYNVIVTFRRKAFGTIGAMR
jgi:hypothetical protein